MTIIPLVPPSLAESSNLPGSAGRAVRSGLRRVLPYLVLLRAGFCLPRLLPGARCALTAPFHPYPTSPSVLRPRGLCRGKPTCDTGACRAEASRCEAPRAKAGGMFSVPLSFGSPRPGVTRRTALRSSDFPPAPALGLPASSYGVAGPRTDPPLPGPPCGAPGRSPPERAKAGDRLTDCDTTIVLVPVAALWCPVRSSDI